MTRTHKLIVAGTVGLIASLFLITGASSSLGNITKKLFTIDKPGLVGKVIEGRKDTAGDDPGPPPAYDAGQRGFKGDPVDIAKIKQSVRDAFQTERDAMNADNRSRGEEFKKKFADHFSARAGELSKRQGYIDNNNEMTDSSGIGVLASGIASLDFKGISIEGNTAEVVVDEEAWTQYRQPTGAPNAGSTQTARNTRQHNIHLELEEGKWKIVSDRWVFKPGTEP